MAVRLKPVEGKASADRLTASTQSFSRQTSNLNHYRSHMHWQKVAGTMDHLFHGLVRNGQDSVDVFTYPTMHQ